MKFFGRRSRAKSDDESNDRCRDVPDSGSQKKDAMTAATLQDPNRQPLTTLDRCDRCGAQAYLRIELVGGSELLFCAHHSREHEHQIRSIAVSVHDETTELGPRPPTVHR
jgi:hypothetical protein